MSTLEVEWIGRVPYARALAVQDAARAARARGETADRLLLLEHPPVVTLGRGSHPEHLLLDRDAYAARGIEVFEAARGGDVTYHAPGQLVGYLIVDLDARGVRDLHRHVRRIEGALMSAIGEFGVDTKRVPGRSGVFVDQRDGAHAATDATGESMNGDTGRGRATEPDGETGEKTGETTGETPAGSGAHDRKLASIGVGVKRWVTWHGFALNVTTDLSGFDVIVPCGLGDVTMTSVARESGLPVLGLDARVREAVADAFREAFGDVDAAAHQEATA